MESVVIVAFGTKKVGEIINLSESTTKELIKKGLVSEPNTMPEVEKKAEKKKKNEKSNNSI